MRWNEDDFQVDRQVAVGVSGGKDSLALALHLIEIGIEITPYFCDTGWEHPATMEYLDYLETKIGPILRLRAAKQMAEIIVEKSMFPSRKRRYCTPMLKIRPFQDHFGCNDKVFRDDLVSATGERAAESGARARKITIEKDTLMGCWMWRPIKTWNIDQVFEIAKRHGVAHNPLYTKGYTRVGCWPCIFANKGDYRALLRDPAFGEQHQVIRELEARAGVPWVILRRESGDIVGIDQLLEWAGSEQPDLFEETGNWGCSSTYKLCE